VCCLTGWFNRDSCTAITQLIFLDVWMMLMTKSAIVLHCISGFSRTRNWQMHTSKKVGPRLIVIAVFVF
jgi:hypothetical protein